MTSVCGLRTIVVGGGWRDLTFVELLTDDGLIGLAEVRMHNRTKTLVAALAEIGERQLIGHDPLDAEQLAWRLARVEGGRLNDVTGSVLAAFDIACHDLAGQMLGVPVWQLLGGRFRPTVPAYANGWYRAERDPVAVAAAARAAVAAGYRALKIDPFGAGAVRIDAGERRLSLQLLAAVRDAVGPDVELMIEMHGRFAADQAATLARALEAYDPAWLEEPVPPENLAALRRVRHATHLTVATGERLHAPAEFRELIDDQLADVLQPDLTHAGGFTQLRKIAGWAEACYLELAPHNVCGPVGTTALVHFAAATPAVRIVEHFNDFDEPWLRDLAPGGAIFDPRTGQFTPPTEPGLGIRLDHDVAAAHPPTYGEFNLYRSGWERRATPDQDQSGQVSAPGAAPYRRRRQ